MKDKFPEWLQKIQRVHPKSDEEVLRFIYDFSVKQGYGEAEEVLYQQFASGYCYYFACMLKAAFNRGEICWAAPFGHIVWVDENGIPYDISGVNESETDDYIPEYMMGDTILDFKHIAGRVHNTSDQEIAKMVLDWHDIKSDQFGGDVTKIKMKKVFTLVIDEDNEPIIVEEDVILEDILNSLASISKRIDDIQLALIKNDDVDTSSDLDISKIDF